MRVFYGATLSFALLCGRLSSQPPQTFTENSGQWHRDYSYGYRTDATEIYARPRGWHLYIHPPRSYVHAGHLYTTYSLPNEDTGLSEGLVYGLSFRFLGERASSSAARGFLAAEAKTNYFLGNDSTYWGRDAKSYAQLSYCDLYPGVDMYLRRQPKQLLKYDLVVRAGADPQKIRLQISGARELFLRDNKLHIETPYGTLLEHIPFAYQLQSTDTLIVSCRYVLYENQQLGFDISKYDKSRALFVDPVLVAASYTGSTVDNWGNTATFDPAGNVYTGGTIFGQSMGNYEATVGAIQTEWRDGSVDVALTKFDPTGQRIIYFTYLGGSGVDVPISMIIHPSSGDLLLMGITSSVDFPTSPNALSRSLSDTDKQTIRPLRRAFNVEGADIFVARISSKGKRLPGSTYVGGSKIDGVSNHDFLPNSGNYGDALRGEIIVDTDEDVVVASWTFSSDFPTHLPSSSTSSVLGDAVLFKISADLETLRWSRLVGGDGADVFFSVKATDAGYFVAGTSSSRDLGFPQDAHKPTNPSGSVDSKDGLDGFVTFLRRSDVSTTTGTFLGTSEQDMAFLLDIGPSGNIHIVGQTRGNYPIVGSAYRNIGGKVFLHKLSPDLKTTLLTTTIGSVPSTAGPNFSPTAFLVDNCGEIYISGWGGRVNVLSDASNGTTESLPITKDAWQSTTDGNDFYLMVLNRDATDLRYATYYGGNVSGEHVDGGTSRFDSRGLVYHALCAGCRGNNDFPTTPKAWSSVNNSPNCNLGFFKFNLSFLEVDLKIHNRAGTMTDIHQGCAPLEVIFENASIEKNKKSTKYYWDLGEGAGFERNDNRIISHTFVNSGVYNVRLKGVDESTCRAEAVAHRTIVVSSDPYAISPPRRICAGEHVQLFASGGVRYRWTPEESLNDSHLASPTARPQKNTTYTVEITTPNGCLHTDQVQVEVTPSPSIRFLDSSSLYNCHGNRSYKIRAELTNVEEVTWHMGDGNIYTSVEEVEHTYEHFGRYTVRIEAKTGNCETQASQSIRISDFFVPNVITPNGDGKNERFVVASSRPVSVHILDRNGALIYRSDTYANDWSGDGLPSGVYFYEVRLKDKQLRCKGWLHLLR